MHHTVPYCNHRVPLGVWLTLILGFCHVTHVLCPSKNLADNRTFKQKSQTTRHPVYEEQVIPSGLTSALPHQTRYLYILKLGWVRILQCTHESRFLKEHMNTTRVLFDFTRSRLNIYGKICNVLSYFMHVWRNVGHVRIIMDILIMMTVVTNIMMCVVKCVSGQQLRRGDRTGRLLGMRSLSHGKGYNNIYSTLIILVSSLKGNFELKSFAFKARQASADARI